MSRSYEIKPRLGGGFVLTMFDDGEEMGRGYYPLPLCPALWWLMRFTLSLKPYSMRLKPMVKAGSPFPPINQFLNYCRATPCPLLGGFFLPLMLQGFRGLPWTSHRVTSV